MELEFNEFQHPYLGFMNIFLLPVEYGSLLASCLLTTCLFSSPLLSFSPALQQELLKPWQVLFLFCYLLFIWKCFASVCVCWLAVHSSLFICAYLHEWLVMLVFSFQEGEASHTLTTPIHTFLKAFLILKSIFRHMQRQISISFSDHLVGLL